MVVGLVQLLSVRIREELEEGVLEGILEVVGLVVRLLLSEWNSYRYCTLLCNFYQSFSIVRVQSTAVQHTLLYETSSRIITSWSLFNRNYQIGTRYKESIMI